MSSLSINKVRNRALNANAQNTNNYSMWLEPLSHKQYPVTDVQNPRNNAVITSNGERNMIIAQPGMLYNNISLDISGSINPSKWLTGQTINTVCLQPSQISQIETEYTSSADPYVVASYMYTPKSNNSKIIVEYDALYVITGFNNDAFETRIVYGDNIVAKRQQKFIDAQGGGTRSGTIFPISGIITNSALTSYTINIRLYVTSDSVRVYGASYDALLKITEIGA
jgi:hypothetical protein